MTGDELISRLHGVRRTGEGEWVARCPAHQDRSPSLAIKEAGGDVMLLHCFAGCPTEDVLAAIGLTFADIMPERRDDGIKRMAYNPRTVLEALGHNARLMAIMALDIAYKRKELTPESADKMAELAGEVIEAMDHATS